MHPPKALQLPQDSGASLSIDRRDAVPPPGFQNNSACPQDFPVPLWQT